MANYTTALLASSYIRKDAPMLTHAFAEDGEKSLCGRISLRRSAGDQDDDPPTCKACLKKDNRFNSRP